jgi:hypothetical protein
LALSSITGAAAGAGAAGLAIRSERGPELAPADSCLAPLLEILEEAEAPHRLFITGALFDPTTPKGRDGATGI